eukprot:TRINITY_DN3139_c0_g2_i1.p1 TRINITY_DN3139_c0_g2~~TRINITY_DN3139_c0_g2_i1.p1  ORF type:complete len:305 (+),score=64.74 TRINITY_DN3139_c0_g2_i1:49-963(+)
MKHLLSGFVIAVVFATMVSAVPIDGNAVNGFAHVNETKSFDLWFQSFNIRTGTANDRTNSWSYRRGMVYDVIRGRHLIGVQEALHFQLSEILGALPQYGYIGVGRDDGNQGGEYSAILYLRELLEVVKQGTFWLCNNPNQPGCTSYGNSYPRVCTWGLFRQRYTGQVFYHYNTHLDHQSSNARIMGTQQIIEHIRAEASRNPNIPFFVTGDFNNQSESSPEIEVMRAAGFVDTFRVLYPTASNVGTFNGFTGATNGAKIDFVWAPNSGSVGGSARILTAEINRYNVNGKYPSDHFPVESIVNIY